MATSYLKSCCDSSKTFVLTNLGSALTVGDSYYAQIPNSFTGCSIVIPSSQLLPGAPTYSSVGATLTSFGSCSTCISSHPCIRITATSECDVITVAPLTIECSPNITASTITINVSGGTPPYKILWDNGYLGATLSNANTTNIYTITVTDYSWPGSGPDYTATTTCTLAPPTPTPTPTPTTTPIPPPFVPQSICLQGPTINLVFNKTANIVNGKNTFTSSTYTIIWNSTNNYWFTQIGSQFLINSNPSNPPIGLWQISGIGSFTNPTTSYIGSCNTPQMTFKTLQGSNPTCVGQSNGAISMEVQNATPPILWSIDGGLSVISGGLSRLFTNLVAGSYSVYAKDANNTIVQNNVTLTNNATPTNYKLVVNATITTISATQKRINFTVSVLNDLNQPTSLPVGTTITFNLVDNLNFAVFSNNSSNGSFTQSTQITKNGVILAITPTSQTNTSVSPSIGTCPRGQGINQYISGITKTYNGITLTGSDVVSGQSVVTVFNPSNASCCVKVTDYLNITQPQITGCSCCNTSTQGQSQTLTVSSGTCPS